MATSLYILYTPNNGDGDMQGPYHSKKELEQAGQDYVTLIRCGALEEGTVKVIDENFNDVRQVYPVV